MTFAEVIALHAIAVYRDGGTMELIDRGKLDSVLAAPQATYEGRLLNETIEEQTAAYWHGVCQAHAFLDGNKRVAFLSAFAFLKKNGLDMTLTEDEATNLTLRIAKGKLTKAQVAEYLKDKLVARYAP